MKIQINETQYYNTGLFGCGHNKRDDKDVRWMNVQIKLSYEPINYGEYPRKSYITVKKHDAFQITCNHTQKMIIRRYISPWLCCILPIEYELNETDTIMIYKEDQRNPWTQDLHSCNCKKYRDNYLMNAKISQHEINGTFTLKLEKKKAVLGDTGWYGCADLEKNIFPDAFWTYVYVKPEKYLFMDINDFKAITIDVNKTLTIPCRPKLPNYQVTLYANEKKINDNDNVIFNNSIGFIIKNVQLKDNGYYECKITLDVITEEKGFDVLVTEPNDLKPSMYPDLSYIELEENKTLELTCTNTQRMNFSQIQGFFFKTIFPNLETYVDRTYPEVNGSVPTSKFQKRMSPESTGFYGCGVYNDSQYMNIRWVYVYVKATPRIRKLRIHKYYEPKEIAEIQNTVVAFQSSNIRSTLEESNRHREIRNMTNIFGDVSKQ
ncbi:hypothetical protein HCN44_000268 [Aphidius gifuensis]|uniref:Immunoglobulin domain-containing protein n=1 Tax=Aphidius gifuensis TaxID=684658 RepID=A0A834XNA3_APHGI|nr:hypothetical protein HCN44_000268 [Aphidius gifuensis]